MFTPKRTIVLILAGFLAVSGFFGIRTYFLLNLHESHEDIQSIMEKLSEDERCFVLTQRQIDFLHSLSVKWYPNVENGMALLEARPSGFLAGVLELLRSKQNKQDLEDAFQIFLAFADMPSGIYPLGQVEGVNARKDPAINSEFHMTAEHLKLLRHANGGWEGYFHGLAIDPKRPYGDMTYFELDMAEILDMPLDEDQAGQKKVSDKQQKVFDQLFRDLPVSLSVYLKNATLAPGRFCRKPAGWGAWRRVSHGESPKS